MSRLKRLLARIIMFPFVVIGYFGLFIIGAFILVALAFDWASNQLDEDRCSERI